MGDVCGYKFLVNVGIEFLSSCRHARFSQGLKFFRLFVLVLRSIIVERLNFLVERKVQCPLCGWLGHKFFPFYAGKGGLIRDNAICPRCWSLERQREVVFFLTENLPKDKPIDALCVAPHPAILSLLSIFPNVRVTTIDLHSPRVMIRMDLHQLGFRDKSFDLVICSHVLEHVRDDIQCMKELCRVLRPGKLALLQVPLNGALDNSIEYGTPDPAQHGHIREYGRDYFSRLESVGLKFLPEWTSVMAARKKDNR